MKVIEVIPVMGLGITFITFITFITAITLHHRQLCRGMRPATKVGAGRIVMAVRPVGVMEVMKISTGNTGRTGSEEEQRVHTEITEDTEFETDDGHRRYHQRAKAEPPMGTRNGQGFRTGNTAPLPVGSTSVGLQSNSTPPAQASSLVSPPSQHHCRHLGRERHFITSAGPPASSLSSPPSLSSPSSPSSPPASHLPQ